jgi:hypothetical protein
MPTLSRSTVRRGAPILLILLTAAACSGGGAGSPAGAPTAPAGSQAPAAATAAAGSPSTLHTLYCNAIKLPDAQVLAKDPILEDQFDPLEATPPYDCQFLTAANDGPKVSIDTTDTFARWVSGENIGAGTALTGVGDKAVWVQALGNAPVVIAIKGSVTCRVSVGETEKSTIEFTVSSAGLDKITPAAAASFAQKMAVLCTDAFGASS